MACLLCSDAESFFKVNMNVTVMGSVDDPENTILTWCVVCCMYVCAYFIPEESHSCEFQMMVPTCSDIEETQRQIHALLDQPYSNGSVSLDADPDDILIAHIRTGLRYTIPSSISLTDIPSSHDLIQAGEAVRGSSLTQQTRQGRYVWPWTLAQHTVWQHCEGDPNYMAYRKWYDSHEHNLVQYMPSPVPAGTGAGGESTGCLLSAVTNQAGWAPADLQRCPTVVSTISDLEHIDVTNDTADDVLQMIEDILQEHSSLDERDLLTVLTKLQDVLNITIVTPDLAKVIVSIMSNILNSESNLQPFTNNILNITEAVGDRMAYFSGESVSFVAPALALSVVSVNPDSAHNLTFGVTSVNSGPFPKVYINKEPFAGTVAFISLPPALHAIFPQDNHSDPRVQFQFYGVPALFKDQEKFQTLNTYVVSASVVKAAEPVENLKEPITVTLHHLDTHIVSTDPIHHHHSPALRHPQYANELSNQSQQALGKDVHCVFWDFNKNDGHGGWSPRGCWKYNVTPEYTTCMCDHLTHFGVLLDVSRTLIDEHNERILTVITYIGCGLSSFFLGVTVLTYSLLEKLRRDYPSQILLNLSIALLGLNLVFLTNSWFSAFTIYGLCVAVAAAQHYFLLASFSWMLLEAVNMYFALVKVFNVYVPSYILKFCIVGWGLPLLICCLVLIVKQDAYAAASFRGAQQTLEDSEMFCWIQDDVVFYVSVVGFVGLVLLCNSSVFLVVLLQMKKMRVNQPAGMHRGLLKDLRGVASLTLLLGLTWSVAFFTWGPAKVPLLYLFSILNSLQGFFIFVFHCLMKENVRKQWRVHLCFGCLKLQDHSEWSHTATVIAKPKPSQLPKFPTVASFRSSKSNSTQSSSLSSDSSQRQVSIRRPNLGKEPLHAPQKSPDLHFT
ncbi:hypothetical protein NFI96_008969 [Prochilodus magdalenae]|nr:hypothetical protein NFI96_008969 [Prochilodus magdalenae]